MKDPSLRFLYRLARDLRMTKQELFRRMSSEEFAEWAAFYNWEAKETERQRRIAQQQASIRRR